MLQIDINDLEYRSVTHRITYSLQKVHLRDIFLTSKSCVLLQSCLTHQVRVYSWRVKWFLANQGASPSDPSPIKPHPVNDAQLRSFDNELALRKMKAVRKFTISRLLKVSESLGEMRMKNIRKTSEAVVSNDFHLPRLVASLTLMLDISSAHGCKLEIKSGLHNVCSTHIWLDFCTQSVRSLSSKNVCQTHTHTWCTVARFSPFMHIPELSVCRYNHQCEVRCSTDSGCLWCFACKTSRT